MQISRTSITSAKFLVHKVGAIGYAHDNNLIQFFATADPQYDNANSKRNAVSDITLDTINKHIWDEKGIALVVSGDLTQNTRKDELDKLKKHVIQQIF